MARAGMPARLLLIVLLAVPLPTAADILSVTVERAETDYHLAFEVLLDAPADALHALIDQPERWPELSPSIRSSKRIVTAQPHQLRVETEFHHCVLFICRTLRKVTDFVTDANGDLVGVSLPGAGDFIQVREVWRIRAEGERSRLQFEATMIPDFLIPPLIGTLLIRTALRDMLGEIEHNLPLLVAAEAGFRAGGDPED